MTDKVVAQSDLFGNAVAVGVERELTRKGTPVEAAIAKRYPPTACVCCKLPLDWFPKGGKVEYLEELKTWCCLGCLKLHGGIDGVIIFLERDLG